MVSACVVSAAIPVPLPEPSELQKANAPPAMTRTATMVTTPVRLLSLNMSVESLEKVAVRERDAGDPPGVGILSIAALLEGVKARRQPADANAGRPPPFIRPGSRLIARQTGGRRPARPSPA